MRNVPSNGPIGSLALPVHSTPLPAAIGLHGNAILNLNGLSIPGMPVPDSVESKVQVPLNASTVVLISGGGAGCAGGAGSFLAASLAGSPANATAGIDEITSNESVRIGGLSRGCLCGSSVGHQD